APTYIGKSGGFSGTPHLSEHTCGGVRPRPTTFRSPRTKRINCRSPADRRGGVYAARTSLPCRERTGFAAASPPRCRAGSYPALHLIFYLLSFLAYLRKKAPLPGRLSLSKKVTFWWPFSRIERENAV